MDVKNTKYLEHGWDHPGEVEESGERKPGASIYSRHFCCLFSLCVDVVVPCVCEVKSEERS